MLLETCTPPAPACAPSVVACSDCRNPAWGPNVDPLEPLCRSCARFDSPNPVALIAHAERLPRARYAFGSGPFEIHSSEIARSLARPHANALSGLGFVLYWSGVVLGAGSVLGVVLSCSL